MKDELSDFRQDVVDNRLPWELSPFDAALDRIRIARRAAALLRDHHRQEYARESIRDEMVRIAAAAWFAFEAMGEATNDK